MGSMQWLMWQCFHFLNTLLNTNVLCIIILHLCLPLSPKIFGHNFKTVRQYFPFEHWHMCLIMQCKLSWAKITLPRGLHLSSTAKASISFLFPVGFQCWCHLLKYDGYKRNKPMPTHYSWFRELPEHLCLHKQLSCNFQYLSRAAHE